MRLELHVDIGGMRRKLTGLVDDAKDIDPVLKKFGSTYLRHKVQKRFEEQGPGWPARSPATLRRIVNSGGSLQGAAAARAQTLVKRKLERELRRAKKNLGKLEDPIGFAREQRRQQLRASEGKKALSMAEVIKRKKAAVARREAVLKVFEAILAGAEVTGKGAERIAAKLDERLGRAQKRASGPLLGKIASSFKLQVRGGTLTYGSTIPWAGVHNEGGTAGHGAEMPKREFAVLEDEDLDVLVDMLTAHLGRSFRVE